MRSKSTSRTVLSVYVVPDFMGENSVWGAIDYVTRPGPLAPSSAMCRAGMHPDVDYTRAIVSTSAEIRGAAVAFDRWLPNVI